MATRIRPHSSTMRKTPIQARSKVTTEAILDAAAHILGQRGWEGLSTNAVAEVAGVSIGSLYQYYPNKLALIEDVRRRHFDDVLLILRSAADKTASRSERIEALVDGMIAVHSRYPAAHRVLLEESPRGKDARATHDLFASECRKCYEAIYRANSRRAANVAVSAQVLASALAGAVHNAARVELLESQVLRAELIRLVESYL